MVETPKKDGIYVENMEAVQIAPGTRISARVYIERNMDPDPSLFPLKKF